MKSKGPQKSQFSNSLVNWEKFGCKLRLKFKKQQQLFIFFMDWEKFRIQNIKTSSPGTTSVCFSEVTVNDKYRKPEFKIKRRG